MGLLGVIFNKIRNPEDITDDTRKKDEYIHRLQFNYKKGHYETIKIKRN